MKKAAIIMLSSLILCSGCDSSDSSPSDELHAAGPGSSGGGGIAASEFLQHGNEFTTLLDKSSFPEELLTEEQFEAIKSSFPRINVQATNGPITLDGQILDAINYPEQLKVVFDQTRWRSMYDTDKMKLVLHELFGLNKIEDRNYVRSRALASALVATWDGVPILLKTGIYHSHSELETPSLPLLTIQVDHDYNVRVAGEIFLAPQAAAQLKGAIPVSSLTRDGKYRYKIYGSVTLTAKCKNGKNLKIPAKLNLKLMLSRTYRTRVELNFPDGVDLETCSIPEFSDPNYPELTNQIEDVLVRN